MGAALRYNYLSEDFAKYMMRLSKVQSMVETGEIAGEVIYAGAAVVTDAFREEIDKLPVIDHRLRGTSTKKLQGITSLQKKGLQDGLGIAKLREENGYYDVKIGFHGYNEVKSVKNPWGGQANVAIARSINSGTSFRAKNPFATRAIRKSKPLAEKAMAEAFDKKLAEIVKE